MGDVVDYVRARMQEMNMKPRKFATKAGINQSTFHRFLHRQNEPRLSTLQPIAKFFGMTVRQLIDAAESGKAGNALDEMTFTEIKDWIEAKELSVEEVEHLLAVLQARLVAAARKSQQ